MVHSSHQTLPSVGAVGTRKHTVGEIKMCVSVEECEGSLLGHAPLRGRGWRARLQQVSYLHWFANGLLEHFGGLLEEVVGDRGRRNVSGNPQHRHFAAGMESGYENAATNKVQRSKYYSN